MDFKQTVFPRWKGFNILGMFCSKVLLKTQVGIKFQFFHFMPLSYNSYKNTCCKKGNLSSKTPYSWQIPFLQSFLQDGFAFLQAHRPVSVNSQAGALLLPVLTITFIRDAIFTESKLPIFLFF